MASGLCKGQLIWHEQNANGHQVWRCVKCGLLIVQINATMQAQSNGHYPNPDAVKPTAKSEVL